MKKLLKSGWEYSTMREGLSCIGEGLGLILQHSK